MATFINGFSTHFNKKKNQVGKIYKWVYFEYAMRISHVYVYKYIYIYSYKPSYVGILNG